MSKRHAWVAGLFLAWAGLMALAIDVAAFNGWRVLVVYNRFGEHWFELIAINAVFAFAVYHCWRLWKG